MTPKEEAEAIKRYTVDMVGEHFHGMMESTNGYYVAYEDHKSALERYAVEKESLIKNYSDLSDYATSLESQLSEERLKSSALQTAAYAAQVVGHKLSRAVPFLKDLENLSYNADKKAELSALLKSLEGEKS